MEPISALTIFNIGAQVTVQIFEIVQNINNLVVQYKAASSGLKIIATQCVSYRMAIVRITKWLSSQTEASRAELEPDFWIALKDNLETGAEVIMTIEKEISPLKNKKRPSFVGKISFMWNAEGIAMFQSQLQGLAASLSMLITVIDMPNLEAKRSQMAAQKPRLKTVSKSVKESEAKRDALRTKHQGNLLFDLKSDDDSSELSPTLTTQTSTDYEASDQGRSSTMDTLATSQSSVSGENQNFSKYAGTSNAAVPGPDTMITDGVQTKDPLTLALTRSYEDWVRKPVNDSKKAWKRNVPKLGRTISDQLLQSMKLKEAPQQTSSQQSNLEGNKRRTPSEQITKIESQVEQSQAVSTGYTQTRAKEKQWIGEKRDTDLEYFDLQQAMSGMSFGHGEGDPESNQSHNSHFHQPPSRQQPLERSVPISDVASSRMQDVQGARPVARSGPKEKKRPIYHRFNESSSETNLRRIRPSQRVRTTSTNNDVLDRVDGAVQADPPPPYMFGEQLASSENYANAASGIDEEQTWVTNTLVGKESRFKVRFDCEAFTNKISRAAARSLGVEDHALTYAGQTVVNLTLLYLNDGKPPAVAGEEVEFELLPEYEARAPTLILGTAYLHLQQIMSDGEYVYWNPGPVPEKLRDQSRLRVLRRFELVRW